VGSLAASALLPALFGCHDDAGSPMDPTTGTPSAAVSTAAALAFWQVSGGGLHSCGLTTCRRAYRGEDHYGQLGDGTFTDAHDRLRPVAVQSGLRFSQLSLSGSHTCGVTTDRLLYCWGMNFYGQLGDSSRLHQSSPVAVAGRRQFRTVEVGQVHTCALSYPSPQLPDNQAYCWGHNSSGQLGDGTKSNRLRPRLVVGGHLFAQVTTGKHHSCAVTDQAFCWGDGSKGQIGDGTWEQRLVPRAVAGGLVFGRLSAGFRHTCGETSGDRIYCWGSNRYGQLGDGTTVFRRSPVPVAGGLTFQQVGTGAYHTCAKTADDVGYCWGRNDFGQVGDGTTTQRLRATPVSGLQ
jgi:alpha-tubulin suppressor-like RCC1 family protein